MNTTIREQMACQKWRATDGHYTMVGAGLIAVLSKSHGYVAKAEAYEGKFDEGTAVAQIEYANFKGVWQKALAALEAAAGNATQLTDAAFKLAQWKRGKNPRAKKALLTWEQVDMVSGYEYTATHGDAWLVIADWRERDFLTKEIIPDGDGSFCCFVFPKEVRECDGFYLTEWNESANFDSLAAAKRWYERKAAAGTLPLDHDITKELRRREACGEV